MKHYTFDIKAFITVTVAAKSSREARRLIDETLDGADITLGEINGETIGSTLSFDGEHDLVEIDGEAVV